MQAHSEKPCGALFAACDRAATETGVHDAAGALACGRIEGRDCARPRLGGPATARIDPAAGARAAHRRAFLKAQESRDAAVGASDSRALVPALRALFRALTDASAIDCPYGEFLRLGRSGDPHPH